MAFQSGAFQSGAYQAGGSAAAQPTGGGGSSTKEWTRGFFKIPEEYREQIEEVLEEAAQAQEPVAEVKRTVKRMLSASDLEAIRRKEYAAIFAAAYLELLQQKQKEDDEIAQVIALTLLH